MAPSPTIRRLLRETSELSSASSNPNPAFVASPVHDSDLHEWHFTLLGPPSPSPYSGGIYHGRITLPPSYPLKPPNFRFLTPSGRFEVNREICLSISGFHEETWMPAWGIRTALTALRSFMSEQGTAGQVGGLEANDLVRKKLADESKRWKCEICGFNNGNKTNQEILTDWWNTCRIKGIKVDEEDISLEHLPDGMNVEVREPKQKQVEGRNDDTKSSMKVDNDIQSTNKQSNQNLLQEQIPNHNQSQQHNHQHSSSTIQSTTHSRNISQQSNNLRPDSSRSIPSPPPLVPTPTAEAIQASAESYLTQADQSPLNQNASRGRISNIHGPPMTAANASIRQVQVEGQRRDNQYSQQTITIDRAIAGIFLALCLMVLKKIFYPATSNPNGSGGGGGGGYFGLIGGGAGDGGNGDFYLQREM